MAKICFVAGPSQIRTLDTVSIVRAKQSRAEGPACKHAYR